MALPTFNPAEKPHPSTSVSTKPKLLEAEFGDGYTQITRDGINHIRREVKLVWNNLHRSTADDIIAFFEERGGDEPFMYRLPDESTAKRWRCTSWDKQYAANERRTVNADLVQDFSLAQ